MQKMLDPTKVFQENLAVDLIKLNRLYKWLSGFFIVTICAYIFIFTPAFLELTNEAAVVFFVVLLVSKFGYYITLGRMAATLHKSVIVWVGGAFVLFIFGFIGSFFLMNSRVTDARQKETVASVQYSRR